jgi:hypothetical protein
MMDELKKILPVILVYLNFWSFKVPNKLIPAPLVILLSIIESLSMETLLVVII